MTSTASPTRRSRNKPQIRDHMDMILESKGFYRKHVASGEESIFRALSDGLFGTQYYRFILAKAAQLANFDFEGQQDEEPLETRFSLVCHLAQTFNFSLEIIRTTDDKLTPFIFDPGQENRESHDERVIPKKLLLCHSPPHQFDPIYTKKTIEHAGMCQSILYELLYVDIFKVYDAMEAANVMLNGDFDPNEGKPEVLDPEFSGSALESLDNFYIPFPYKVAKCLDPQSYRNIEYDIWLVDKAHHIDTPTRQSPIRGPRLNITIGNLPRGTPCVIRYSNNWTFYGYVQGPTMNNKMMEVFLPLYEQCVYVERGMVLPIEEMPAEMQILPRFPNESPRLTDSTEVQEAQGRNLLMVKADDPNWLGKSDFSVPPPAFEDDEAGVDDECIPIPEPEFIPPPPLDLSQINNNGNLEDFCYACSSAGAIPPLSPGYCVSPTFVMPSWNGVPSPYPMGHMPSYCYFVSPVMSPMTPMIAAPPSTPVFAMPSPLDQQQVFVFPDVATAPQYDGHEQ